MRLSDFADREFLKSAGAWLENRYIRWRDSDEGAAALKNLVASCLVGFDKRLGFSSSGSVPGAPYKLVGFIDISNGQWKVFQQKVFDRVEGIFKALGFDMKGGVSPFVSSKKALLPEIFNKLDRFAKPTDSGFNENYLQDAAAYFVLNAYALDVQNYASFVKLKKALSVIKSTSSPAFNSEVDVFYRSLDLEVFSKKYFSEDYATLREEVIGLLKENVVRGLRDYVYKKYKDHIVLCRTHDDKLTELESMEARIKKTRRSDPAGSDSFELAAAGLDGVVCRLRETIRAQRFMYSKDRLFELCYWPHQDFLAPGAEEIPLGFLQGVAARSFEVLERIFARYNLRISLDEAGWRVDDSTLTSVGVGAATASPSFAGAFAPGVAGGSGAASAVRTALPSGSSALGITVLYKRPGGAGGDAPVSGK